MNAVRTIDLNADLGEGGSQDAALMALASSVNIACGGHAGDEKTMRTAITSAVAAGVAIGAHPGYEDRANFGRMPMNLSPAEVTEMVGRQIGLLATLAAQAGAMIHHVKPHGALYNQADRDPELAAAIAEAVNRILPGCRFYVPPGGALAAAGTKAGLTVRAEGFVDRFYQADGSLVPRGDDGALIDDPDAAVSQALRIACQQEVITKDGTPVPLPAQTLCVHGDSPCPAEMLKQTRLALEQAGFTIRA